MNFSIIIPAHNEEDFIGLTLESLINQTLQPQEIIVVNDNSTDNTQCIVEGFAKNHNIIKLVNNTSTNQHLPGSKIINAFYKGYEMTNKDFDIVCKFDADLIFPTNYLEALANHFNNNPKLGMASGFCFIKNNEKWVLEKLTRKDHIRGALKSYRKQCFSDIGGLKSSMGWDTVDELLSKFYGWELLTDKTLKVKHLKPTGASYNKKSKYLQGEAMYKMRYGFIITVISALKLAYKKRSFSLFRDYVVGYFKAQNKKVERLVTKEQGGFIRKLRWKGITEKLS